MALWSVPETRGKWSNTAERPKIDGHYVVSAAIGFVDRTSTSLFRPAGDAMQNYQYDSRHRLHCKVVFLWIQLLGKVYKNLFFFEWFCKQSRYFFDGTESFLHPESYFDSLNMWFVIQGSWEADHSFLSIGEVVVWENQIEIRSTATWDRKGW